MLTKISRAHSVGKYDPVQGNDNKKADNRYAQRKTSNKVDLYHIPHLRGRRHRLHTQKLPTRPYEARKRHGHAGRRVQRRGRFISEVKGNESVKGIDRKYFSASPLVGSLLTFLPKQESKAPGREQSNSEKTR